MHSAVATGLETIFIPIPKKGSASECSNYCTIALISHASKVILKISKLGFSSMWTENSQMFKLDLEKAEETRSYCQHQLDHRNSKESQKTSTSASLTMLKSWIVWITINCGKFLKRWEYTTTLSDSQETCVQVKEQQWELYREQRTGSKLGKEYLKAV